MDHFQLSPSEPVTLRESKAQFIQLQSEILDPFTSEDRILMWMKGNDNKNSLNNKENIN